MPLSLAERYLPDAAIAALMPARLSFIDCRLHTPMLFRLASAAVFAAFIDDIAAAHFAAAEYRQLPLRDNDAQPMPLPPAHAAIFR
jgi:hypothetical protein